MSTFAGIRGTGNWGVDERPKHFREMILWLSPNGTAPLFALSARMRKQSLDDPEFSWFEEKLDNVRLRINFSAGYGTSDTTLTVYGDGLRLEANDVLQVEKAEATTYDNELLLVSSVTNDTTIVVKRGQAGSTAAAIPHNTYLTKLGSSFFENTGAPKPVSSNPVKLRNYAEIFKTSVGISRTADQTRARTGNAWLNDKKRRAFAHAAGIEWSFLFGRPYEDLSAGPQYGRWFTGGLRHFITTNVRIFTTTPTEDDLLNFLSPLFDFDTEAGDERIVFAGNGFLNSLNKLVRNSPSTRVNFNRVIDLYGMKLTEFIIPQGRIAIKTHPLMNRHPRYTYSAFVIDPTNIIYRPMQDTVFKDNVQANDLDGRMGLWLTQAGIEVHHESTMGYIGNFVV